LGKKFESELRKKEGASEKVPQKEIRKNVS
jgi:hypothetical protein